MQEQPKLATPAYARILFLARWPFWALIAALGLFGLTPRMEPITLAGILAAAAGLSIVLFAMLRLGLLVKIAGPLFSAIDAAALIALLLAAGAWPTPFYPLLFFPIVTLALCWGEAAGALSGLALGLVSLVVLLTQSSERIAALSPVEQGVALAILPLLGLTAGLIARRAAGERIAGLSAEVRELRRARDHADTVYELAATLGATVSYQKVLQTLFDLSAIEFRYMDLNPDSMVGLALLFESRLNQPDMQVIGGHNLQEEDWSVRCPGQTGILERVLTAGEPRVLADVAGDPELRQFKSLYNMRSAILVPLRAGFDSYGVILFASPQADAFNLTRCHFLVAFANQATIALQNARLFESLREEQNRIVSQQEKARKEIARELHDGPVQTIAALAMRLNYARTLLNINTEKAARELADLEDLARRTSKEIRTMLFTLRPVVLETQGLAAALRLYGERLQETDGLQVNVDDSQLQITPGDEAAGVIFAILEEAINNARKHAHAQRVTVTLRNAAGTFYASVEDDGIGFDLKKVEQTYDQRGSLGLVTMKERAALLDGNLAIESSPGAGSRR